MRERGCYLKEIQITILKRTVRTQALSIMKKQLTEFTEES